MQEYEEFDITAMLQDSDSEYVRLFCERHNISSAEFLIFVRAVNNIQVQF